MKMKKKYKQAIQKIASVRREKEALAKRVKELKETQGAIDGKYRQRIFLAESGERGAMRSLNEMKAGRDRMIRLLNRERDDHVRTLQCWDETMGQLSEANAALELLRKRDDQDGK